MPLGRTQVRGLTVGGVYGMPPALQNMLLLTNPIHTPPYSNNKDNPRCKPYTRQGLTTHPTAGQRLPALRGTP